jgi:PHD/YefM family antitoxin component YafN of YafNO toxin-antitoxin module
MFHHMTITQFRKDTARAAELTRRDHVPLLLTQGSKTPLVVMSLDDFGGYEETEFLRSNPRTHRELMAAIARYDAGAAGYVTKTVEELEEMVKNAEASCQV